MKAGQDKITITLSLDQSFRPKLKKLLSYNSDIHFLWNEATISDFLKTGLREKDYEKFCDIKKSGLKEKEYEIFLQEGIRLIYYNDTEFPDLLKQIKDPPAFLFVKGDIKPTNSIGVVGARKATRYGESVARQMTEQLAAAGLTIVSGLAIGIDSLAHRAALSVRGRTIAVLGSGINNGSIYPQTNWILAEKIIEEGGALVSEYPPNYSLHKMNFPERNRIISGISEGVLIVEAREKSGALITADFALEQGRDVFAVPHDIIRVESVGTNNLIKEGAIPVTSANDILDYWGLSQSNTLSTRGDSPDEDKIIEVLSHGPLYINAIANESGLTIEQTSATLSLMEIKGRVINQGSQTFSVKR